MIHHSPNRHLLLWLSVSWVICSWWNLGAVSMSNKYLRNPSSTLSSLATFLHLPQLLLTIIACNCSMEGGGISAKRGQRTEKRANVQTSLHCCM